MMLSEIKGLKYPDEYFIKFFFKNRLHEKNNLKYLEFGCGSGNNLLLPYQYDNKVLGIDYNKNLINNAKENFSLLNRDIDYTFYSSDMLDFAKNNKEIFSDVLSLPNVVNYISKTDFIEFLNNCSCNKLYKEKSTLFIRFRTPRDFRYGLGRRIDSYSYQIDNNNDITGEAGALNCFYTGVEMIEILKKYLKIYEYKLFNIDFENMASNGDIILNSDIVIWGKIS